MKYLKLVLVVLLFITHSSLAQDSEQNSKDGTAASENTDVDIPLSVLEQIPIFPGCETVEKNLQLDCFNEKIKKHIQKHIIYPQDTSQMVKVLVKFIINIDGTITVVSSKSNITNTQIFENEAERIIKILPRMKPGIQKGKPVRVSYSIPITFMAIEE